MTELVEALRKLIQEGGTQAVYVTLAYMGLSILRTLSIGVAICLVLRSVFSGISLVYTKINSTRTTHLQILSDKASSAVTSVLENFSATGTKFVESLQSVDRRLEKWENILEQKNTGVTV